MKIMFGMGLCFLAFSSVFCSAQAAEPVPHQAVYDLSLDTVRNGSPVTDIEGRMLYELRDSCDGWTVVQNLDMRQTMTSGEQLLASSVYTAFESRDGRFYRFIVRRTEGDKVMEDYAGEATLPVKGPGRVLFTKPVLLELPLPLHTLFPVAHFREVERHAGAGERFFSANVLDGTDGPDGPAEVEAMFLKKDVSVAKTKEASLHFAGDPLRVRFAFFPRGSGGDIAPAHEMTVDIYNGGIVKDFKADYGTHVVRGELARFERLPSYACPSGG